MKRDPVLSMEAHRESLRTSPILKAMEDAKAPPGTMLTNGTESWIVGGEKPKSAPVPSALHAHGFLPHSGANRNARRSATAKWTPPESKAETFWSDVPADLIGAFNVGQVQTSGDGEKVRVTAIDLENGRVQVEAVPEPMPTRRELLLQRKRRARGTLDVELRRLQRKARNHGTSK